MADKKQVDSQKHQSASAENNSRRKVLKSTLAGGVVITTTIKSEEWVKPVVNSVIIPAHAQTSATTTMAPTTTTMQPTTTLNPNANVTAIFSFSQSSIIS